MIKIIVILLIIIGLSGHFIPIKTYAPDPGGIVTETQKVTTQYRIAKGKYADFKQTTEDIICTVTCGNTVHKLYLW